MRKVKISAHRWYELNHTVYYTLRAPGKEPLKVEVTTSVGSGGSSTWVEFRSERCFGVMEDLEYPAFWEVLQKAWTEESASLGKKQDETDGLVGRGAGGSYSPRAVDFGAFVQACMDSAKEYWGGMIWWDVESENPDFVWQTDGMTENNMWRGERTGVVRLRVADRPDEPQSVQNPLPWRVTLFGDQKFGVHDVWITPEHTERFSAGDKTSQPWVDSLRDYGIRLTRLVEWTDKHGTRVLYRVWKAGRPPIWLEHELLAEGEQRFYLYSFLDIGKTEPPSQEEWENSNGPVGFRDHSLLSLLMSDALQEPLSIGRKEVVTPEAEGTQPTTWEPEIFLSHQGTLEADGFLYHLFSVSGGERFDVESRRNPCLKSFRIVTSLGEAECGLKENWDGRCMRGQFLFRTKLADRPESVTVFRAEADFSWMPRGAVERNIDVTGMLRVVEPAYVELWNDKGAVPESGTLSHKREIRIHVVGMEEWGNPDYLRWEFILEPYPPSADVIQQLREAVDMESQMRALVPFASGLSVFTDRSAFVRGIPVLTIVSHYRLGVLPFVVRSPYPRLPIRIDAKALP